MTGRRFSRPVPTAARRRTRSADCRLDPFHGEKLLAACRSHVAGRVSSYSERRQACHTIATCSLASEELPASEELLASEEL
jgi:hypothetical protein